MLLWTDNRKFDAHDDLEMIRFILTSGHRYTLEPMQQTRKAPAISLWSYDRLIRSRRVEAATYVFTDFDRLSAFDLELASRLYLQLKGAGMKVVNNPAKVKTRYALLRALHRAGLNDFNVHPAGELPAEMRFPVYIRRPHGHGEPSSGLLHGREEVEKAIAAEVEAGVPVGNLMVIEYAGEPVRPGLYRKLAAFRIGAEIVPYLCGHDTSWLVKEGITGIAGEELYQDEARLMRENPYAEHLRRAFEIAEIEYGRADFGFYQGRIQIFEINTNPNILAPDPHPFPTRVQTMEFVWNNIARSLHGIDSPEGPRVKLPRHGALDRYRKWMSRSDQTRFTP
jgi:hypothetical protein